MNANMKTILYNNSSSGLQFEEIQSEKSPQKKKLFITIIIIVSIIIIITVTLLIVLLSRNDKNRKIVKSSGGDKQSIELLIEGYKDSNKGRNLQENGKKVKILGDSFHELNPSNANIYINGEKIDFNKSLDIETNEDIKLEIVLLGNIKTFKNMFKGCKRLKSVTLNKINTTSVSDVSSMFEGCTGLNEVKFEKMNISNIEYTSKMFKNCTNLNNIDINNFFTDKVKDMSQMFEGCSSLISVTFISQLSTKSSKDLTEMFFGCSKLTSLDLSGFDTSISETMKGMFKNMTSLIKLNLNNFNTKKVLYMNEMFENCTSIESLDLSSFNTENVFNISRMFFNCGNLKELNLSSFNISKSIKTDNMFENINDSLEEYLKKYFYWTRTIIDNKKTNSFTTNIIETTNNKEETSKKEPSTNFIETTNNKEETTIKELSTNIIETTYNKEETITKELSTNIIETTYNIAETTTKELSTNIIETSYNITETSKKDPSTNIIETTNNKIETTTNDATTNIIETTNNKIETTTNEATSEYMEKTMYISDTTTKELTTNNIETNNYTSEIPIKESATKNLDTTNYISFDIDEEEITKNIDISESIFQTNSKQLTTENINISENLSETNSKELTTENIDISENIIETSTEESKTDNIESIQDNYAVLVAGSKFYLNYRHQSDIFHMYQILKSHGVNSDNIIVFAYDDIANNIYNPFPGQVFNKPDGKDVYAGVKIDYFGEDVTPENFIAAITGDVDAIKKLDNRTTGKVLNSTKNDNIFMYFSDHGNMNLISFPNKYLFADQLNNAFKVMYEKGLYKELVFYLEACYSGSMFDKELPTNISIYTTTAANESESSYGIYCYSQAKVNGTLIDSCLGDEYSVRFMEDFDSKTGDEIKSYTLQEQYEYLVEAVLGSNVKQYGDLTIAEKSVSDFISKASSNFYMWVKKGIRKILPPKLIVPIDIKINNENYRLEWFRMRAEQRNDFEAENEYYEELLAYERVTKIFDLFNKRFNLGKIDSEKKIDYDCYRQVIYSYQDRCGTLIDRDFKFMSYIGKFCKTRIQPEKADNAFKEICQ